MAIPTYAHFIEPILRYLATHPEGAAARDVHEAAADALGISGTDRQLMLASGAQLVYKNRAGWAHDRLKRIGLSDSPRRGFWQLTPAGVAYAAKHPPPLPPTEIERLAKSFIARPRLAPSTDNEGDSSTQLESAGGNETASPDDRLDAALLELRQAVADELLNTLGKVAPAFFESIVLDLLHHMGYGTTRADLQRIGGAGDGGVDGVIALDRLGLEKVYAQAKRWQSSVGRPEIQAFYGALAGQNARKGVFITTSSYTPQALDLAHKVEGIVLIDGARLVELMIDHEVGVHSRALRIPRFDSDYFDDGV